jgi:hypothetical protein
MVFPHEMPLTERQTDLLKDLYYNKKLIFGIHKLFKYVQKNHPTFKIYRKQIENWLKKQEVNQLYLKRPQKQKSSRQIYSNQPDAIFQSDLIDFSNRSYKGFNYILMVVDIYSRFLWAFPLKNKTVEDVKTKLFPLLRDRLPSVIQTDNGTEFNLGLPNEQLNIKHIKSNSYTPQNQAIVERINGTLKSVLFKALYLAKTNNWIGILDKVVDAYNTTYQRMIKTTPKEAYDKAEIDNPRNKINKDKDKVLDIGTLVRIKTKKNSKGEPIYSLAIYEISKILKGKDFSRNRYKLVNRESRRELKNTLNNTQFQVIKEDVETFAVIETRAVKRQMEEEEQRPKRFAAEVKSLTRKN